MNSYWEDIDMSADLKTEHNRIVSEMNVPEWAIFDCPFCNEKLEARAIRNIGMCFNARNIGDIAVEFCCDKCSKMDTMYFRQATNDVREFIDVLDVVRWPDVIPKDKPIIEEKMFEMQYNNLMEIIHFHKEK